MGWLWNICKRSLYPLPLLFDMYCPDEHPISFSVSKWWIPSFVLLCFSHYLLLSPCADPNLFWKLGTYIRGLIGEEIVSLLVAAQWADNLVEAARVLILAWRCKTTLVVGVRSTRSPDTKKPSLPRSTIPRCRTPSLPSYLGELCEMHSPTGFKSLEPKQSNINTGP